MGPEREEVWEDVIQYLKYEKSMCPAPRVNSIFLHRVLHTLKKEKQE